MTGVNNSIIWTQSDAIAEVVSGDGCHIVLETSPPDYVEKISRYLESSVGQSRQDKGCNDPAEAGSDSGDSLFLTQKPVPEAVRSGRRRHYYRSRSDPSSPTDLVESEDDASSSISHGESKADKERRRKKYRLSKYSFPFLAQRKWRPRSTLLSVQQNTSLHNHAMGGFFKCVRELWQGYQRGENLESSLPTVDVDGDYISPLSEEEEEKSEDEDIKVVEKKRFVAPLKAKRQPTWGNQLKQQRNARQENSRGTQWKMLHKIPAKSSISRVTLLSSDTESSDDGELSCKVLVEKDVRRDENFPAQTETPKTKRRLTRGNKKILFQQKARDEEPCNDSDATVCEPRKLQTSPKQCTQKGREASTTETQAQTDVLHIDDLSQTGQAEEKPESKHLLHSLPDLISDTNDDRVCAETRVKKRKKKKKDKGDHESVEEEKSQQSQEEPEGLHAATCVTVELEETPSLSEENRAEPLASQPSDELEFNENNCMEKLSQDDNVLRQEERDIPDSKQKKKKKTKNESAAENVRQEVDGNLECDVRMEDSVFGGKVKKKKKKKKRKRSGEDDEDVEQLQSVAEPLNDVAVIQKKKNKRKKEERIVITEECEEEEVSNRTLDVPPMSPGQLEESGHCLENTAASEETLESSYVKRKKHKKKQQSSFNDACLDGEGGVDVSFSNDAVTLVESTGMSLKKKKKKKKTVSEGVNISHTPEENEKVENLDNTQKTKEGLEDQNAELVTKKKKKKKKISEISSRNISEDNVAQSDDSVSVRKKEKKRTSSFLVADAEENNAQTHGEPNSPSQSVDACASAADFEAESAEVAGKLKESNDGVRKKKRKRKMSVEQESVEKDHKQDFEEPNKTCRSALPETTDAGVKRKKKRKGNESELVTPVERLESAADAGHSPTDEAVVLKKKKKKKRCKEEPCRVIQESPPNATQDTELEKSTLNTCTSVSLNKKDKQLTFPLVAKGKHGRTAEISHDSSTSDQATKETLNTVDHASPSSETPGNQVLNDRRDKKKKGKKKSTENVSLEGNSSAKSAELEPQENKKKKKKERNKQLTVPNITSSSPVLSETSLSKFEMSSSDSTVKKKHIKVKRRLHNPNEDFLTDD